MVQYLVEQGADLNKTTTDVHGYTPLAMAVELGHLAVAVCLMECGLADLNVRTKVGQRPIDVAPNQAMRQAIINEEKRRRDDGFKRSVLPPNRIITAEEEDNENGGEGGQATAIALTNAEVEDEDDGQNDDSGSSDEED